MKRWAIARMVDDGFGGIESAFNRYRCNTRIWSKTGFNWCFGQIAAPSLTEINADPDIYVLPDGVMDMSVGTIPAGTRTTMRNRLEAAGFTFTDVKTSWTVRQLLNYLKAQLDPGGEVEQGDVPDIEQ
jgi:hypothetical protein